MGFRPCPGGLRYSKTKGSFLQACVEVKKGVMDPNNYMYARRARQMP